MRRLFLYIKKHPGRTVLRVVYAMPFILTWAFVYFLAGALGMVPTSWNCHLYHVKTVSALGIDFDVSNADCLYGPFYSETPTVVRASQRGDWFRTKIFEYGGIAEIQIEAIDKQTIRISIPEKFGESDREINVRYVFTQQSKWRSVNFIYDQAGPDSK